MDEKIYFKGSWLMTSYFTAFLYVAGKNTWCMPLRIGVSAVYWLRQYAVQVQRTA